MAARKKTSPEGQTKSAASSPNNGRDRKASIVAAFRRCMLAKGYSETSLTDIAKDARMSVSHLLYYYSGKDMILVDLYRAVSDKIVDDLLVNAGEPPEERIHLLADHMFATREDQSDVSLIREFIALSTHIPGLNALMREFSEKTSAYLEDLFSKVPRRPHMTAWEAAQVASALWMGLGSNSDFNSQLPQSTARRLFRKSLLDLANFPPLPQVLAADEGGDAGTASV